MLDFLQLSFRKLFHVADDRFVDGRFDHAEQPVVVNRLAVLSLIGADDADEVNQHETADDERHFVQHEHIESIAVLRPRVRNRAEVEWNDIPAGSTRLSFIVCSR